MRMTEIVRFFFVLVISSMSMTVLCQFYLLYQKNYQDISFGSRQLKGVEQNGKVLERAFLKQVYQLKEGDISELLSHRLQQRDESSDDRKYGYVEPVVQRLHNTGRNDNTTDASRKILRNNSMILPGDRDEIGRKFYARFAQELETKQKILAVSPTMSKVQRINTYAEAYKKYNISSKKGTVVAKNKRGETKVLVTRPHPSPTNATYLGPMLDFGVDFEETDDSGELVPGYKRMVHPKGHHRERLKKVEDIKTPGILNSTIWKSYIDLHEYRYILNPKQKCLTDEGTFKRVSLLMIVASAPKNFERRDAIRRSWGMAGRSTDMHIETVFLVGAVSSREVTDDLSRELVNYGDIVQEDFVDSYLNLTIKTVMGLKWASRYCQNAKFVMKTDDDMAVNTIKMLIYLRTAPSRNFVAGKAAFNFDIIRDVYNKFYVPYSVTKDDKYPPYCIGIGYVISMDVVHKAYIAALQTPLFPWEDVFFGLCLRRIGVIPTMIKGFMGGGFFDDAKGGILKTDHTSLNRLRSSYVIHDLTVKQLGMVWGQWAGLAHS
ncbi:uncharacterized protein LOC121407270 [Lytechinus variegatus]|uniref:uncharacterized protein LOC121407270 n=1 Tax=Lytechinus variegatus TaxID=7654 RepID=UPI001BB2190D|nr:uncharacterized protein LOC121407270 [Lytechinus variegatus]